MQEHARRLNFLPWRSRSGVPVRLEDIRLPPQAIWQWPGRVASLAENGQPGPWVWAPCRSPNARRLQRSSQVLERKSESTPKCSVEGGNNCGDSGCARESIEKLTRIRTGGPRRYRHELLSNSSHHTSTALIGIMISCTNRNIFIVNPSDCGFSGILRMADRASLYGLGSCDRRGSLPMDSGHRRWHQLSKRRHLAMRQERRGTFDP
jgi:hypothetical protein